MSQDKIADEPPQTLRLFLAQLNPTVGDLRGNCTLARTAHADAQKEGADLLVLPELFLTGYPPEDLMLRPSFQEASLRALKELALCTKDGPGILIGAPWRDGNKLYNAVVLLSDGTITAQRFKVKLPNYGVFDEVRIFDEGPMPGPLAYKGFRIGMPICEDIWYEDVTECLMETGSELLIAINSSPFSHTKHDRRMQIATKRVVETGLPLVYLNNVGGQDELIFDGRSFVLDGARKLQAQLQEFVVDTQLIELERQEAGVGVQTTQRALLSEGLEASYKAAVLGLRDYVEKNGFKSVLLGLSGGIDSALTAAICVDALGAKRVHCVMLPYEFTSQESLDDARFVANQLNVRYDVLPIKDAVEGVEQSLSGIFKGQKRGVAEENIQSRLRGTILMAISNKFGSMLVTTGNKSEVSVGYATLYGDMNGGYNPIKDIYKTDVFALSKWRDEHCPKMCLGPKTIVIGDNIINKAPSAELRADQKDEDSLPPYEVLDELLRGMVDGEQSVDQLVAKGHDKTMVKHIEHLLFLAEYKRRQSAPGVRLSQKNFGRDRRYPITNKYRDE